MPKKGNKIATQFIPQEAIERKIFLIRGHKIMLDRDLAALYEVATKNLNKAVKRNSDRFPNDFMFRLTGKEFKSLMFHFGTSSWGGIRKMPYAFTEQGVAMLSSVLTSRRAIRVNVQIMRAFVNMKRIGLTYVALKRKIDEMERKYDKHFKVVFDAIRGLMAPPNRPKRRIGFHV